MTTTDSNGKYVFTGLDNGDYVVVFNELPGDYKATTSNVGSDDAVDSDGLVVYVTINNADDMTIDLGLVIKADPKKSKKEKKTTEPPTTEPPTTEPPTTEPPTTEPPTTEPPTTTEPTVPTYKIDEIPDPKDPNSPDEIIIIGADGNPLGAYKKHTLPNGDVVYISEAGVPLGTTSVVKTGNDFPQYLLIVIALLALVGLFIIRRAYRKQYND
ncbi:MAG: hypothetical protein CSB19_00080 [Clostridiales bacterium]|nr:MAG: hypothetical protein CSB19_00080 [Clostridiales bacterium]